jgi:hypothetical protein
MPRKKQTESQMMAMARINAMRHGFASRSPVIPVVEDEADWKRHLRGMNKSFAPEGYFEECLVRRLATILWEIDRLTAYNVAATMRNIGAVLRRVGFADHMYAGDEEVPDPDPLEYEEVMQRNLLPDNEDLEIIMRFGGQLHRQWIQVHNQLVTIQARRRGEKVSLAMLDIIGAPPNLGPFRSQHARSTLQLAKDVNAQLDRAEGLSGGRSKGTGGGPPAFLAKDA